MATADRTAPDGSPYPDRSRPTFERDVRAMFTHIARRYDWFDHLVSLGQDYTWRPRALWALDRHRDRRAVARVLDVGCGTGDLTRLAAHHYAASRVLATDFTAAMLERAAARTPAGSDRERIDFTRGTALSLPFRSGSFDVVMSAFVVRNLPRLPEALRELARVLAPGGSLLTLEITEPTSPAFRRIFHRYFDHVVPFLGGLAKSAGPYRYLPESLRSLPDRATFLRLLGEAGLARAEAVPQSIGSVTAYLAERPAPRSEG